MYKLKIKVFYEKDRNEFLAVRCEQIQAACPVQQASLVGAPRAERVKDLAQQIHLLRVTQRKALETPQPGDTAWRFKHAFNPDTWRHVHVYICDVIQEQLLLQLGNNDEDDII
ncbi:hypothetical protein EYF80_018753 [Liparis tanakae]|uniref:Uncharacterized protein n=1 Tax=Liparis tanakae TaxID=230148 RepID=A0A4Z2HYX2_9TELE|nr:hypothetical protein EYF80_018753 [Liparis tanakae]